MTKETYNYFSNKELGYFKKAILFYGLFIAIFLGLITLMFFYQIYSYFVTFIIILVIMYFLYRLVFYDFIYYVSKTNDFKRIKLMKKFGITEEVLNYFEGEVFKQLFDDDFVILHKNDVYVLAKSDITDSIHALGLAVYFLDNTTDEISPTTRELSNELSGYIVNSSVVKVILLVKDKFEEDEMEALEYDSAVHKNTVIIGLEKSTSQLIYNYFLNGEQIDAFLGKLFKVDLVREDLNN